MSSPRIIVTGGSGKVGAWIVSHFVEHGYSVLNVDTRPPAEPLGQHLTADLNQLGQVVSAFSSHVTRQSGPVAGVVHLGAIPRPFANPNDEIFRVNTTGTYNVLEACGVHGIKRVVLASSESSYGHPFARVLRAPRYLPLDEDHPQEPEDTYGLTKIVNEATATMFHRRDGTQIVSLRIAHVFCPEEFPELVKRAAESADRASVYWSYIDVRDLAAACLLAIERDGLGCQAVNLCADDTTSSAPSAALAQKYFPATSLRRALHGREGLIANARAKQLLGWKPKQGFPL